eukprot:scaffold193166_cov12-Tisochrysis_lutea.AAC.1
MSPCCCRSLLPPPSDSLSDANSRLWRAGLRPMGGREGGAAAASAAWALWRAAAASACWEDRGGGADGGGGRSIDREGGAGRGAAVGCVGTAEEAALWLSLSLL